MEWVLAVASLLIFVVWCAAAEVVMWGTCGVVAGEIRVRSAARLVLKVVEVAASFMGAHVSRASGLVEWHVRRLVKLTVPLFVVWCAYFGREVLWHVVFAVERRGRLNWVGYFSSRLVLIHWALWYYKSIESTIFPVYVMARELMEEAVCENGVCLIEGLVYVVTPEGFWRVVVMNVIDCLRVGLPIVVRWWQREVFVVMDVVAWLQFVMKVVAAYRVITRVKRVEWMPCVGAAKGKCFVCQKKVDEDDLVAECGHFIHVGCAVDLARRKLPLCCCGQPIFPARNRKPIAELLPLIEEETEESIFRKVLTGEIQKLSGYTFDNKDIDNVIARVESRREEIAAVLDDLVELDTILEPFVVQYLEEEEQGFEEEEATGYEALTDDELKLAYCRLAEEIQLALSVVLSSEA